MKTLLICSAAVIVLASSGIAQALTTTGWAEHPSNPVYSPGKAYYPSILIEGGTYRMWSDNASGVQMATSADGINWTTVGQVSGLLNPRHTVVKRIGDKYRIWYNEGSDAHLYSIEAIRTATSSDGLAWTDDKPITQVGTTVISGSGGSPVWRRGSYGPGCVIYNPSGSESIVVPVDESSVWQNTFIFYYMATSGWDESIGLAVSNDGINWHGYVGGDLPVLAGTGDDSDWDWSYVGYPTVIKEGDGAYHMWYCGGYWNGDSGVGHGIGYASSTDGINWTRHPDNPIFHKGDGVDWRDMRTYTPVVIGDQMWFSGKDADTGVYAIGYATPSCTPVAIESLFAEPLVVQVGEIVNFEASIVGGCGQIDALWDFDDGTFEPQTDVSSPVLADHTYTAAGVYTVVLAVSDNVVDDVDSIVVVAYDPDGGFVTGGGWLWSPAGAYLPNIDLQGKASFGFVSKYRKGASEPTGQTEFVFKAADLNFHSTSYDWLVVTGSDYAKFKGTGTINGWPEEYKFMLWAGDGDPDTFTIKIWQENEESGDEMPIYQNPGDQPIDAGSIVVHTK